MTDLDPDAYQEPEGLSEPPASPQPTFDCAIERQPPRYGQQTRCREQCPHCATIQHRAEAERQHHPTP